MLFLLFLSSGDPVYPSVLLRQIALGSGRTVTFEGQVDDVANAALAAGLADTRPRAWVRALLPARWAMVRRDKSQDVWHRGL